MFMKTFLFLLMVTFLCGAVDAYSSFWAPLFNPKILNYKVDATFDPTAGINMRENYRNSYGYRGEKIISDLGNGKPPNLSERNQEGEQVHFYYTYKK